VVTVPALGGRRFDAVVVEKGVMAHQLSRSYEVKLRIDGRDNDLMPGMVAEVTLLTKGSKGEVPVIPARVVQTDEHNRTFVWTVSGGKAVRRDVTCGSYRADGVEIESGLSAGDRIIVEGQAKVCNGTPVTF
jgi:membrane fusion protein (multidrug efflux system)